MVIAEAFPSIAPFRVDQVMAAPRAMALLFVAQGVLAGAMSWAAVQRRWRLWGALAGLLLILLALFFTLASWGNSDTTKLSHFLAFQPIPVSVEPFWRWIAPLVVRLPYRMSLVHGLVAAAYGAAPILLARAWGARAWGGWWALFVTCNPMLRGFLQNAHSRQALSVLLLLPLLLHTARLLQLRRRWQGVCVLLAALTHSTFVFSFAISLLPLLGRVPAQARALLERCRGDGGAWLWRAWARWLPILLALGLLAGLAPLALERLRIYAADGYFNTYPLRPVVFRLQAALALGLVLGSLRRRLHPWQLLQCDLTRLLLLMGSLYLAMQLSIQVEWWPQVASRLADAVAFFQIILCFAWVHRYRVYACLLPAMYVTFQYWLEGRILQSAFFDCGHNDEFLCIPDRWPWQLRY